MPSAPTSGDKGGHTRAYASGLSDDGRGGGGGGGDRGGKGGGGRAATALTHLEARLQQIVRRAPEVDEFLQAHTPLRAQLGDLGRPRLLVLEADALQHFLD